jgi:uncharacterized protein YbjQ (UPF0145 family)
MDMTQMPSNATTASSIEGWTITSYLGIVASHVVAGTGFGSDMLAGFSDFFGGRSGAYQNQLASLYDEAIRQVYRKTEYLGGNWIIGLKVDIDEVSGKGMQMFMVTATGTAVRAAQDLAGQQANLTEGTIRQASKADIQNMQRRLEIVEAVRHNGLMLDDSTWEFIVEQHVEEAAQAVLDGIANTQDGWRYLEQPAKQRPLTYFRSLPAASATKALYRALQGRSHSAQVAVGIMRDLSLMSLPMSLEALRSDNPAVKRFAVQTLAGHQQSYGESDCRVIDEVISELASAFSDRPQTIQKKGVLGGTKDRWVCGPCGEQNSMEDTRCSKCSRDLQGFLFEEITPPKATGLLKELRQAISAVLQNTP